MASPNSSPPSGNEQAAGRTLRGLLPSGLSLPTLAVLLTLAIWAHWSSLGRIAAKWWSDPQYSHGYLVPVFAVALLWMRRSKFPIQSVRPAFTGIVLLAGAIVFRLASAYYYVEWFDFLSLIPTVAAVVLAWGGPRVLKWAAPAILFLFFMIPLPHTLETAMRTPLRGLGTYLSTYALQTLGFPALAEGHVVVMENSRIGVVEACSGLRMLVVFFALAAGVAMVLRRVWWERLVIVLSAVPIAIIANVTRIVSTGILTDKVNSHVAHLVFHDLAGWLMMPLGLLMLWGEVTLLGKIFVIEEELPLDLAVITDDQEAAAEGLNAGRETSRPNADATAPQSQERERLASAGKAARN
jgi:exosortase